MRRLEVGRATCLIILMRRVCSETLLQEIGTPYPQGRPVTIRQVDDRSMEEQQATARVSTQHEDRVGLRWAATILPVLDLRRVPID